jgi:UDP-N-acetylmuramoylalanine--D-glutamate ligase
VGAAILGQAKGFDVFLSDAGSIKPAYLSMLQERGIRYEQGGHSEPLILSASEVVKSPGIPDTAPPVQKLLEAGVPVISEIEFAGRYTKAKTICVTGSNGKTTTASLIYHIMKQAGLNVRLGGNIGRSFALQVATEDETSPPAPLQRRGEQGHDNRRPPPLSFGEGRGVRSQQQAEEPGVKPEVKPEVKPGVKPEVKPDYYVLELSSFQLDNMYRFKADIAVLLNITPDHMDRYGYSLENYAKSKLRIAQNMDKKGCFIYCADDEVTMKYLPEAGIRAQLLGFSQKQQIIPGGFLNSNNTKLVSMYKNNVFEMLTDELPLKGKHNLYNTMAAGIAGQALKIKKENIRNSLMSFESIEHRLEPVLKVGGVLFINDSKATNINAAWYALESMTAPTVWIVGGVDKGNDYGELAALVKQKVKAIVCMGVDNDKIHKAFKSIAPTIVDTQSAEEAVKAAYALSAKGDTVLLSPACASFDLFQNYEDRGRRFKSAVRYL